MGSMKNRKQLIFMDLSKVKIKFLKKQNKTNCIII